MPAEAMAAGELMKLVGALARAGSQSNWKPDYAKIRNITGRGPDYGSVGNEANAAAGRMAAIDNPWLMSALTDQAAMANMQQQYIDELTAQATGQRSYSAEEMARQEQLQRGDLQTLSNSARDRFANPAARARALQEQAGLHQRYILPTQTAMANEQNAAQDLLNQVLMGRGQLSNQAMGQWVSKRETEDKNRLFQENLRLRHRIGGADDRDSTTRSALGMMSALAKNSEK